MSRRVWFPRDAQFTADPKVHEISCEHGPAGIVVLEEILALAKLAEADGAVTFTYAVLAARSSTTAAKARRIVADAISNGFVSLVGEGGSPKGCSLQVPKWGKWNPKDPTAAERKARERERQSHADVTPKVTEEVTEEVTAQSRPPRARPRAVGVSVGVQQLRSNEETEGSGAIRLLDAAGDDERLRATVTILQTAPRLKFDPMLAAVANVLAMHPHGEHEKAAHFAVSRSADPNYKTTDAGRALDFAFADLEKRQPSGKASHEHARKDLTVYDRGAA